MSPIRLTLAGLLASTLLTACSFQPRADPRPAETGAAPTVRDSVLAVLSALNDARTSGDVSSALRLFAPGARVGGVTGEESGQPGQLAWQGPAEALEEVWGSTPPGGDPALIEATIEFPAGRDLALVLTTLPGTVDGPEPTANLESLLLTRTPEGWRIYNLHRTAPRTTPAPSEESGPPAP